MRYSQNEKGNQYQIISVANDNIKILTLNDSFVNEFVQKKIAALAEPLIELVDDIDKTIFESRAHYDTNTIIGRRLEQTRQEIEELRA